MNPGAIGSTSIQTESGTDPRSALFEAIVTHGPGATVLIDEDATVTFCSASIERILGYQPEDLVGRHALDFVHADDLDEAAAQVASLLDDPHIADPTLRIRHLDGHYEWIGFTAVNQLDDPRLRALVLALRNVGHEVMAEQRIRRILQDSSGATIVIDESGGLTWRSPGAERFIGEHDELTPDVLDRVFAGDGAEAANAAYERVLAGGSGVSARIFGQMGPTDDRSWVDIVITNALDDPAVTGIIVNIRDVDEAVRAGDSGHRLTAMLENTTDIVCMYDSDFNRLWANAAALAALGDAAGTIDRALQRHPLIPAEIIEREVRPALIDRGAWRGEITMTTVEGRNVPVDATLLLHQAADGSHFVSLMARDISERKRLEAQLQAKARHDPLTGLPNRLFLTERLEARVAQGRPLALLFLDLDQFKAVNDTQGHDAGDQLLVEAAERLRTAVRPTDVVGRFGGDEFVVILDGIEDGDQVHSLATRILDELRGPVQLGAIKVYLTGSMGVAIADGADASTLISNADAAMYKAKADGRDRVAFFTSELRARSVARLDTAHRLRNALEADELRVWFQPVVDTESGLPIAVEALARWSDADLGDLPTQHLIDVAEETGLIHQLGAAVFDRTCAAVAELGAASTSLTFSVNLSAHQLSDPELIDTLERALVRHDVQPERLVCEVTESAVMLDVANSSTVLDGIRKLGVGIAIDDFGTGYSSLAYLRRFPVDVLKIDREFISDLRLDSEWNRSLAAGIVSLGHSLGLRIVAEGVELEEQADVLRLLGCDGMQGYLFARPVPLASLPGVVDGLRRSANRQR